MIADDDDNRDSLKDERGAKRQRIMSTEHSSDGGDRDHYTSICSGNFTTDIRNSWLKSSFQVSHTQVTACPSETIRIEAEVRASSIKSFSWQLIQAKRRLWPAAMRCAEATNSSANTEFTNARRICNPMEPLGEGRQRGMNQMFMNRSAIKLANIDAMLEYTLTTAPTENFLFVDLAGAPGGFSEYLLKRCMSTRFNGSCRGYGMSLTGTNEHGNGTPWKLSRVCHKQGSFQANYNVSGGADGSGDLYSWDNVIALGRGIGYDMQSAGLQPQKVHLVVADGGFDAQRDSECQEELAQKLVLCEIAAALYLLKETGTFIIKMFGFQTSVIRTAMRDLFDNFDELKILKPISSRPASSERYLVCTGFRGVSRNFDGREWMNSVILRDHHQSRWTLTVPTPSVNDNSRYSTLDKTMDEFDRDLIQLNLKTCFAILSCLDRKTEAQKSWNMQGVEEPWETEFPPLNVSAYKHAWRLDSLS